MKILEQTLHKVLSCAPDRTPWSCLLSTEGFSVLCQLSYHPPPTCHLRLLLQSIHEFSALPKAV